MYVSVILTTAPVLILFCVSWAYACQSRTSPVLQLRPVPPDGSSLIWYKRGDQKKINHFKNDLDNFLKPYLRTDLPENAVQCHFGRPDRRNQFCHFQINQLAPCDSAHDYGFKSHNSGPCVFLTLSQFPKSWTPRLYNSSNLPHDMPFFLKEHVRMDELRGESQKVRLSCVGDTATDKENIGPVMYMPLMGFDTKYFVNWNAEGYLSPLVAVFFERPTVGVLINVLCTAWASNIERDPEMMLGTLRFQLMVD